MFPKLKCYYLLLLLLLPLVSLAQVGVSPYSSQGLGNLVMPGFTHNMGMGGIGIATGNGLRINSLNPAMLYKNTLTTFDVAFSVEANNLSSAETSGRNVGGGLAYGAFVFPAIANRMTISVGLSPYSNVGYTVQDTTTVTGNTTPALVSLQGDGGTSQVYLASGVRIYKNLAAGVKVSYLFGAINRTMGVLPLTPNSFTTSYEESVYYAGLIPEAGIYYGLKIGKESFISVGATYQPETQLKANQDIIFASSSASNVEMAQDTVASKQGNAVLPQKIGFGIGIEKYLTYMIGLDVTMQQWEAFDTFYESSLQVPVGQNNGLQNSTKIALGGEFIPDATSVNSYLKRVSYRFGVSYQHTPFYISGNDQSQEGEQIQDMGLSLGLSLPLANLSSLNLALEAGKRGTTDNGLIRQNYYKLTLGVSFNDRWFVRRKYD